MWVLSWRYWVQELSTLGKHSIIKVLENSILYVQETCCFLNPIEVFSHIKSHKIDKSRYKRTLSLAGGRVQNWSVDGSCQYIPVSRLFKRWHQSKRPCTSANGIPEKSNQETSCHATFIEFGSFYLNPLWAKPQHWMWISTLLLSDGRNSSAFPCLAWKVTKHFDQHHVPAPPRYV